MHTRDVINDSSKRYIVARRFPGARDTVHSRSESILYTGGEKQPRRAAIEKLCARETGPIERESSHPLYTTCVSIYSHSGKYIQGFIFGGNEKIKSFWFTRALHCLCVCVYMHLGNSSYSGENIGRRREIYPFPRRSLAKMRVWRERKRDKTMTRSRWNARYILAMT